MTAAPRVLAAYLQIEYPDLAIDVDGYRGRITITLGLTDVDRDVVTEILAEAGYTWRIHPSGMIEATRIRTGVGRSVAGDRQTGGR